LGVLTPEGFRVDAVSWRDFRLEEEDSDVAPWGLPVREEGEKEYPFGGLVY
jgi:hypothetical protein